MRSTSAMRAMPETLISLPLVLAWSIAVMTRWRRRAESAWRPACILPVLADAGGWLAMAGALAQFFAHVSGKQQRRPFPAIDVPQDESAAPVFERHGLDRAPVPALAQERVRLLGRWVVDHADQPK